MVATKIWSCVSPDEQEFFGEILMRFGSQFHAQSLQRRKSFWKSRTVVRQDSSMNGTGVS